ncbi:heme lyase CcmF/NrfE family subunit [Enterovibrio nigricans]|uniref:Cytochrome c-type biogenesis protein CcmF n=1 Tax=Enterovibrio nigricans DSM 22720 TaxID=1121868 RepID=A0A1T4VZ74_9GAMM|nr:heme lyase CcmF/NrfE family subunit [Enterovibrio nigricans]PKF49040.1 heme lyase CcmF/NrfE family subunit [Enterovibrio nigricans]SKA70322.1 cytochrome c-type biogenesis protein CcmF [Enterovibrio nigricans DSM 22720]
MFAELAHYLFILGITSVFVAGTLALFCLRFSKTKDPLLEGFPPALCVLAFISILASTGLLAYSFYTNDFSVRYVAQHSNSALPLPFKLAAVWGGHEGSFLFMVLTLSGWTALISTRLRDVSQTFRLTNIAVLCWLISLLGIYCLYLSNPFLRDPSFPLEGRDLNPMLQDVGLIVHPPLLYLGYIGFAIPFSLAIAAMTTPVNIKEWAHVCRNWALPSWAFLTAGIAVGAWWAYNELGWGGWWFWDPVENASLLPWLTATALIHCLIMTERKKTLLAWSLLLAIITFALSILGTFIVRSGVLTSVHAFATDPMRGSGLLIILTLILLPAVYLYALNASRLIVRSNVNVHADKLSLLMLCGAGILFSMMLIVMLGTFYPLIYSALGLGTLSVGAPYFNSLFVPLVFACAFLASIALLLKQKRWHIAGCITLSITSGILCTVYFANIYAVPFSALATLAFSVAFCLLYSTSYAALSQKKKRNVLAFSLGHIGVALSIIGATMLSTFSDELSLRMQSGEKVIVGQYSFLHSGSSWHIGPNFTAEKITFVVNDQSDHPIAVSAEKRLYTVRSMNMSEAGIYRDGVTDIYITLGTKFNANAYAVRIQIKPGIHLLWLGACLMAIAGLIATAKVVYLRKHERKPRYQGLPQ